MRISLLVVVLVLAGCSTVRNVGDLELLNDIGLSSAGEVIRAYDKTMNIAGNNHTNTVNTSSINTGYGNAKQLPDHTNDFPTAVAEVQDILRYIKR